MNAQATVSVIIPVAPYHTHLAARAIESVQAQTVPCTVVLAQDLNGRGAGVARNAALSRVTTDFVIFLDADDQILPTFVEKCLAAWKPERYVYTDWLEGGTVHQAPDRCWCDGNWHVITALIPTANAQVIGFDESLPAAEDTAFFMQLVRRGVCGIRVPEPLFLYGAEGERAKNFVNGAQYTPVMETIKQKYGGKMACCGDNQPLDDTPVGERQPGDVLARAMWGGNRVQRGLSTGRWYERTGNYKTVWVDPSDVLKSPHLWQIVETKVEPAVQAPATDNFFAMPEIVVHETPHTAHGVEEVAAQLWPSREAPPVEVTLESLQAVKVAEVKPDVKRVRKLAKRGKAAK